MRREAHVQFWEGQAVRFRRATQLSEWIRQDAGIDGGSGTVFCVLQR